MAQWNETGKNSGNFGSNEKNSGIQYTRFYMIDDTYFLLLDDEDEEYALLIQTFSGLFPLWESTPKNLET